MITLRLNLFRAAVISSVLLVAMTRPVHAENYRLAVSIGGAIGGSCVDTADGALAGLYADLFVEIWPVGRRVDSTDYVGVLAWEWPADLQVMAGQYEQNDSVFVPDLNLTSQIGLQFYVDHLDQAVDDSLWRQTGETPRDPWFIVPRFTLKFHLPPSLTGQSVCFRATYSSEQYGNLVSEEHACLTVWAPCSALDTSIIRESLIEYADNLGDWPQVVLLVDSLKQLGWYTMAGSGMAQYAAVQLGQYERALGYLDTCYARFGMIITPLDPTPPDSVADRWLYEHTRQYLLELIEEHR